MENAAPLPSYSQSNKKGILLALIVSIFAVVFISIFAFFLWISESSPKKIINNTSTTPASYVSTVPTTSKDKKTYLGKGREGKYALIDIETGETKTFIPQGYTLIDQHEYEAFTPYLILQKEDNLYSFNINDNLLKSIFDASPGLKLKKNEGVFIYPSITENDQFLLVINNYQPSEEPEVGIGLPTLLGTRSYFYSAATNKLTSAKNTNLDGCLEYDSKNQRFFTWPCGEGIGQSAPLSIADLNGNKLKDIITAEEFGLKKDTKGPVGVYYENGYFFAISKGKMAKIIAVDPKPSDLSEENKETFLVSAPIQAQISEAYPYSVSIAKEQNTIVVGGDNYILLLRYDKEKEIIQSTYLPDNEIYANFLFIHDGKLIYQAKENIKIVDLVSWQVEKSLPSPKGEEITLFSW